MRYLIDPDVAVHLKVKSRVLLSWYSTRTGFRFAVAIVTKAKPKKYIKLRVHHLGPDAPVKKLTLKLIGGELRSGKQSYDIYGPGESEQVSIRKVVQQYLRTKLGWRYVAKQKYVAKKQWQYWAARRVLEMQRCAQ